MEYLAKLKEKPAYVLFGEDDFTVCEHGLRALHYLISKTNDVFPDWIGLRVSYGFNGIVIKYKDVPLVEQFFKQQVSNALQTSDYEHAVINTPPDHLMYQFLKSQEPRKLVVFRYNLFYHIGQISTFENRQLSYTPQCYQYMYDWLLEGERFHNEDCPNDDIWPCKKHDKWNFLIDFDKRSEGLCRIHFPLCSQPATNDEEAAKLACRLR